MPCRVHNINIQYFWYPWYWIFGHTDINQLSFLHLWFLCFKNSQCDWEHVEGILQGSFDIMLRKTLYQFFLPPPNILNINALSGDPGKRTKMLFCEMVLVLWNKPKKFTNIFVIMCVFSSYLLENSTVAQAQLDLKQYKSYTIWYCLSSQGLMY